MNIEDWESRYFNEPDRAKRKELLDEREALEGPSDELSFIRKLYEHRYTPAKAEPDTIDHMLRGVLYLKLAKNRTGIFGKPSKKELLRIREDLGLDLAAPDTVNREQIFYREFKHLGKTYFSICAADRGYTSFIWGMGQLSDNSLKNKMSHDEKTIAHDNPEALGLAEVLKTFTQAFDDAFNESVK